MISKKALEDSARAVHEAYNGKDTWKAAATKKRSAARQAVRVVISALEKNEVL